MTGNRALVTRMVEKPWGRTSLPPPFQGESGQRIGEVWFEPPPEVEGLLVKYIFTSDKLSVQVHPSDEQAAAAGLGRTGKEECWLVLAAEPNACLGIGFADHYDSNILHQAALDGSIEQLLAWHPVAAGDFFYIPAGTVHAIGAGISLIEVQQNSDITYRLYDYGRPRPLHLEAGLAVAKGEPHPAVLRRRLDPAGTHLLVDGPLFRLARFDGPPSKMLCDAFGPGPVLAIPLDGTVRVGLCDLPPGSCGLGQAIDQVDVPAGTRCLVAQNCA